ncbi:hypothetical protein [Candidatus Bealeia paramacronuclearis]
MIYLRILGHNKSMSSGVFDLKICINRRMVMSKFFSTLIISAFALSAAGAVFTSDAQARGRGDSDRKGYNYSSQPAEKNCMPYRCPVRPWYYGW